MIMQRPAKMQTFESFRTLAGGVSLPSLAGRTLLRFAGVRPFSTTPHKETEMAKTARKRKKVAVQDQTPGSVKHDEMVARYRGICDQIRRACAEIGARFYELGCAWRIIRDDRLWAVGGHRSFAAYIEDEVHQGGRGPTKMTVYNCMKVAESLTLEQALRLGPTLSYAVAKDTDKVQKEVPKLIASGVSTKEVMAGLREKKAEEKAAKSKAQEEAASLGLTVIQGGGQTEKVTATKGAVKKAAKRAEEKRKAAKARDVERGTVRMESTRGAKAKAGWAKAATIEVGGLTVTIEVNNKKGMLRYRTQ